MVVVGYQKLSSADREDYQKVSPLIKGLREIVRSTLSNFTASGLIAGNRNYC